MTVSDISMHILGINAYHGDVSAVLVEDGQLVAALEEERFRPKKGLPMLLEAWAEVLAKALAVASLQNALLHGSRLRRAAHPASDLDLLVSFSDDRIGFLICASGLSDAEKTSKRDCPVRER
jgi:predicted nucleotidyltransferase